MHLQSQLRCSSGLGHCSTPLFLSTDSSDHSTRGFGKVTPVLLYQLDRDVAIIWCVHSIVHQVENGKQLGGLRDDERVYYHPLPDDSQKGIQTPPKRNQPKWRVGRQPLNFLGPPDQWSWAVTLVSWGARGYLPTPKVWVLPNRATRIFGDALVI